MERPTLKEIACQDHNYHEIKANELQNDEIKPDHALVIKDFSSQLSLNFLKGFIIFLFFDGLLVFLSYSYFKDGGQIWTKEFFLIATTVFCFSCMTIRFGKLFYLTYRNLYQKAQYGEVRLKYFRKSRTSRRRIVRRYYAHVIFPSHHTLMKGVSCTEEVYHAIGEGSEVVVVSFDYATTYVISIPND